MEITHITAHLGGGVGSALATLCESSSAVSPSIRRRVICLEPPEKLQFVRRIRAAGVEVFVNPPDQTLKSIISQSDIIQVEFWNHPATLKTLHSIRSIPIRLAVWCHISGTYNPAIPAKLVESSNAFIVTTPCSLNLEALATHKDRLRYISSAAGIERLPVINRTRASKQRCRFGYVGTTNFTKMHPKYVDFIAGVHLPGFQISVIGDDRNRLALERSCVQAGIPNALSFVGYKEDIASALSELDVLVYLLSPRHYGTAEIALLEAMAMGVVPIVLDNPCERELVEHNVTGVVASTPEQVRREIVSLAANPDRLNQLSETAAKKARSFYTAERMLNEFQDVYRHVLRYTKAPVNFEEIFGASPDEWFLSCKANRSLYEQGNIRSQVDKYIICEITESSKGSVTQFSQYFPENTILRRWKEEISDFDYSEV